MRHLYFFQKWSQNIDCNLVLVTSFGASHHTNKHTHTRPYVRDNSKCLQLCMASYYFLLPLIYHHIPRSCRIRDINSIIWFHGVRQFNQHIKRRLHTFIIYNHPFILWDSHTLVDIYWANSHKSMRTKNTKLHSLHALKYPEYHCFGRLTIFG